MAANRGIVWHFNMLHVSTQPACFYIYIYTATVRERCSPVLCHGPILVCYRRMGNVFRWLWLSTACWGERQRRTFRTWRRGWEWEVNTDGAFMAWWIVSDPVNIAWLIFLSCFPLLIDGSVVHGAAAVLIIVMTSPNGQGVEDGTLIVLALLTVVDGSKWWWKRPRFYLPLYLRCRRWWPFWSQAREYVQKLFKNNHVPCWEVHGSPNICRSRQRVGGIILLYCSWLEVQVKFFPLEISSAITEKYCRFIFREIHS